MVDAVLRLYNTLSKQVEPLRPINPMGGTLTFYSCGPTVYDDAHVGNFRTFLAADVLRRWIESPLCVLTGPGGEALACDDARPRRVLHVMNITDVGHMTDDAEGGEQGEDRMAVAGRRIAEAKKSGRLPAGTAIDLGDPYQIAGFYAGRFREDARRLGLRVAVEAERDATLMPRATEHIEGMRRVIEQLWRRGYAYVAGQVGARAVYFDVRRFGTYGRLSGNTLESLREGAGGRVSGLNQSDKRHPADFLLWKEDPAHIMKWPSPRCGDGELGPGYPGWHIECTVMSASRLLGDERFGALLERPGTRAEAGAIIDLHSGGEDNIFPHHECEIAQSCCAFCEPGDDQGGGQWQATFARHWFHARHLFVEGEKMSKSKGNFYTARDLFASPHGFEAAAVRLELIRTNYRSNANFTMQGLRDSRRMVERWRRVIDAHPGERAAGSPVERDAMSAANRDVLTEFGAAMSDDLNIAGALGVLNKWIGEASGAPTPEQARVMRTVDRVLGVLELERATSADTGVGVFIGCEPDAAVLAKLEERAAAKRAKDFARSDGVRAELGAMGYAIKDVAGGKVEVRRG